MKTSDYGFLENYSLLQGWLNWFCYPFNYPIQSINITYPFLYVTNIYVYFYRILLTLLNIFILRGFYERIFIFCDAIDYEGLIFITPFYLYPDWESCTTYTPLLPGVWEFGSFLKPICLYVPNILFNYIYLTFAGWYGKMDAVPMVDAWCLFWKRGLTGPIWKFQGFLSNVFFTFWIYTSTQWSGLLHILYMCGVQSLETMAGWGQFFWVFQLVHLRII
jgi:hypothetical protein